MVREESWCMSSKEGGRPLELHKGRSWHSCLQEYGSAVLIRKGYLLMRTGNSFNLYAVFFPLQPSLLPSFTEIHL